MHDPVAAQQRECLGECLSQLSSPTLLPPYPPAMGCTFVSHCVDCPLEKPGWASWLPVPFLSHEAYDYPDIAIGPTEKGKFSQTEHVLEKMGKRGKTQLVQGKSYNRTRREKHAYQE